MTDREWEAAKAKYREAINVIDNGKWQQDSIRAIVNYVYDLEAKLRQYENSNKRIDN